MSILRSVNSGNEKGIATMLGLIMLFIASIIGLSIMYMSQKEKAATIDSSAIRSVAVTADASLKACEKQLLLEPDNVIEILNKYSSDPSYKWLLASSASQSEKKKVLDNSGFEYSASIAAFDKVNKVLQIKGNGYGRNGEAKSVIGIYKLNGIGTESTANLKYALYLAGDGRYFDAKVTINGDVYVGSDIHFNSGAANSRINGTLKTGTNESLLSTVNAPGIVVDSAVYIGTKLHLNNMLLCKSKTGVEGNLELNSSLSIQGDGWFNGTNSGSAIINMSSGKISHSGSIDMSKVISASEDNKNSKIPDIVDQVGLASNDSAWEMTISALSAKAKTLPIAINAESLQWMYNNCWAWQKFNGYMVVRDNGEVAINHSTFAFNGKVIWLIKGTMNINGNWFTMTPNSRMIIYAYDKAELREFGGKNNTRFNGLIYVKDKASLSMQWTGILNFYGAIHLASKDAIWQCNNGNNGELILNFDNSILSEFVSMGILKRPANGSGTPGKLVLTDCKIRPQLMGMLY